MHRVVGYSFLEGLAVQPPPEGGLQRHDRAIIWWLARRWLICFGLLVSLGVGAALGAGHLRNLIHYLFGSTPDPQEVRLQALETGLIFLAGLFALSFSWAMSLYLYLRRDEPIEATEVDLRFDVHSQSQAKQTEENDGHLRFHELAREHKLWSQLWFTISLCVFLGGLIFALSKLLWVAADTHPLPQEPIELAREFITDLFTFSLFYLSWNWSVRHFRAHWHNFILNAYRYRALRVLKNLTEDSDIKDRPEIRRLTGLLLLMTESSAYLDNEQESSLLERINQLDDLMKKVITGAKPA